MGDPDIKAPPPPFSQATDRETAQFPSPRSPFSLPSHF